MTYKLPHPLNRPGQQEAFNWIMASKKKYLIIRGPTGSGKSAWAAAASVNYRTLTLVETKSLQSTNYLDSYNFDVLYGKANYPCRDNELWTAFDCDNRDGRGRECSCPYNIRMKQCIDSMRVSLNYAKYLVSNKLVWEYKPQIMFLDEGHNLPDIVTEHIGLTIRWDNEFIRWDDEFARRKQRPNEAIRLSALEALPYFYQCSDIVERAQPSREKDLEQWRKWKRLNIRMSITSKIIGNSDTEDWYFEADKEKLTIKPLTAKYHFEELFNKASKVVLMSATIKPPITKQLGIDDNECDFYEVPNPWPAPSRLIWDLECPKMKFGCTDGDKDFQARRIASVLDQDKSGIIHVSSKFQAYDLSSRLFELGFETWTPPEDVGTDNQLRSWYDARTHGRYCISWSFHEGVDLGGDDICIIAKVPYGDVGDNYNAARMEYDKGAYFQNAAYSIEQALGRIQRGKKEHYNGSKKIYIADGSWQGIKHLLSSEFKKAIRKWNGEK